MSENDEKKGTFWKIYLSAKCSNGHMEGSFATPLKNFWRKTKNFPLNFQMILKKCNILYKGIFPQTDPPDT